MSGLMPLLIKARFTRSFLAQIIGLRIHYKVRGRWIPANNNSIHPSSSSFSPPPLDTWQVQYFESDDHDLYTSKVQYVLDNDVTDLGLVFAEEEFRQDGVNPVVVPLIDHGEGIDVVEGNKVNYLNLLAQHRLSKNVKDEVESFLKGTCV